jgi:hypothetical protein
MQRCRTVIQPEEFPAVTVPSGLKAGFSCASAARLVSRRGRSSVSKRTLCFALWNADRGDLCSEFTAIYGCDGALMTLQSKSILR